MKKGLLGEGLVEVASIFLLIGIVVVFYLTFIPALSYGYIKGIEQIITSEKVASDGGILLKNMLNTPVENINLYEFILINQNDKDKIKEKVDELIKDICVVNENMLKNDKKNICLWGLEIKFPDKTIFIKGGYDPIIFSFNTDAIVTAGKEPSILPIEGFKKEFKNKLSYNLELPDYNNKMVKFQLNLFKGIQ